MNSTIAQQQSPLLVFSYTTRSKKLKRSGELGESMPKTDRSLFLKEGTGLLSLSENLSRRDISPLVYNLETCSKNNKDLKLVV